MAKSKRKRRRLPFAPPNWTNQPLRLFHGTLLAHVKSISAGVSYQIGGQAQDFGPGFYTTTVRRQAILWGWTKAHSPGDIPVVVEFTASRNALAALDSLCFVRGAFDAVDYWSFVTNCRLGSALHGRANGKYYDIVAGPVAAYWAQRSAFPDYDQVSFHSTKAINCLTFLGVNWQGAPVP